MRKFTFIFTLGRKLRVEDCLGELSAIRYLAFLLDNPNITDVRMLENYVSADFSDEDSV